MESAKLRSLRFFQTIVLSLLVILVPGIISNNLRLWMVSVQRSLDISDTIDLDSLRIQKLHEQSYELTPVDTVLDPPGFEGRGVVDPIHDLLSEIINQVNNTYGVNLTDENRIDLSRLKKRLVDNLEIEKYMTGNNSDENKRNYFKQQFEDLMVDYVNERFELKWSNPAGHLAKMVKLPTEVRYDDTEKAAGLPA